MTNQGDFDRQVVFQIEEQLGVLAEYSTGWRKELNLVSWNGNAAKYDIRDWSPNHDHMSRGVTLHEKEMRMLVELLRRRRVQKPEPSGGPDMDAETLTSAQETQQEML